MRAPIKIPVSFILITLLIFSLGICAAAQSQPDFDLQDLKLEMNKVNKLYGKTKMDSLSAKFLELAKYDEDPKHQIDIYQNLSTLKMISSQYDSADFYNELSRTILDDLSETYRTAEYNYYFRRGGIRNRQTRFFQALDDFEKSLLFAEGSKEISMIHTYRGISYEILGDRKNALEEHLRSYNYRIDANLGMQAGASAQHIGQCYFAEGKLDSAEIWYEKAKLLPIRKGLRLRLMHGLIRIYLTKKEEEKAALALISIATDVKKSVVKKELLLTHWLLVSSVLNTKYAELLSEVFPGVTYEDALQKAATYVDEKRPISLSNYYQNLSEIYKTNGELIKAYGYLYKADSIKNAVYENAKVEGFRKEKEILEVRASKEKEIDRLSIERYQIVLVAGLLLLVILVSFYVLLVRKKNQVKEANAALIIKNNEIQSQHNQIASQLEKIQSQQITIDQLKDDWVRQLQEVVLENVKESNAGLLAERLKVSERTVHRKLKDLTGFTPEQFIKELRLTKAKELLEQEGSNVSEVAFQVGFENLSHFSTSFKKRFNKTPSEFLV